ncbi:MAG: hypothetical protein RIS76_451, partial [Verrucomicrobiota bacterium]
NSIPTLSFIALVGLAGHLNAQIFNSHTTGQFGPNSTLGGVAFGTDTGFSFDAQFDISSSLGFGFYQMRSFSITLESYGTFTMGSDGLSSIILLGPNSGADLIFVLISGLVDVSTEKGFAYIFSNGITTSGTSFELVNPIGLEVELPFNIPLTGVTGGLVVNDFGEGGQAFPTATFTLVPEPGEYAAVAAVGLVAFGSFRTLRRRERA